MFNNFKILYPTEKALEHRLLLKSIKWLSLILRNFFSL